MRVQIVDPSAFTPPYDHALSAALARAGAEVELVTSRFLYGPVPREDGYRVTEAFYRRTAQRGLRAPGRRAFKLAEHLPDMRRYRRLARQADLVHYQWLTVPRLDRMLLPPARPRVMTLHYPVPADPGRRRSAHLRRLIESMDATVVHSRHALGRLEADYGVDPERLELIHHGAFDYLTRLPEERPLPDELASVRGPVVLAFGLVRPYKGTDVLIEAFGKLSGAELWVVGMPRISLDSLREQASRVPGTVRFVDRFIPDPEIPAYMRRADLVVLPYREVEQSGVLYTALAFGKPIVLSAVGGFPEVAEQGAARLVPPVEPAALAEALGELLDSPAERARLAEGARAAAAGPYSWDRIGERTLALYRRLLGR
jgi:glycosyltransferase involved in cell wall biosynthesis